MTRICIICRDSAHNSNSDLDRISKRGDEASTLTEESFSLIKCIGADVSTVHSLCQEYIETETGNGIESIYCLKCRRRNDAASQIFKKKQETEEKLKTTGEAIIERFRESLESNDVTIKSEDGFDAFEELFMAIRSTMSEGLQVFPEQANDKAGSDYDDASPAFDNFESTSDQEDKDLQSEDVEKELLRKFGILRSTVALRRLTKEEIDNQLPKIQKGANAVTRRYKCPFEDCNLKSRRRGTRVHLAHLINQHHLTTAEAEQFLLKKRSSKKSDQKEFPSKISNQVDSSPEGALPLYCTFMKCDFVVQSDQLHQLKQHLADVHELTVSDFEDTDPLDWMDDLVEKMRHCPFNDCLWRRSSREKYRIYEHVSQVHGLQFDEEEMSHLILGYFTARQQYFCTHGGCPFTKDFLYYKDLEIHIAKYHTGGAPRKKKPTEKEEVVEYVTCETCGKVCRNKKKLQIHRRTHNVVVPWNCVPCNKTFKQKIYFNRHMNHVHSQRKWECEVCGEKWNSYNGLYHHRLDKHGSGVNGYLCPTCGKSFTSGSAYRNHVLKHKEQPEDSVCEMCGKQVSSRHNLQRHMQTVHNPCKVRKPYTKNPSEKRWSEKKAKEVKN